MLPSIVLEEIFSQLDRKQVYKLRLLCLAFYQAAFPSLLGTHCLKQAKYINYQRFLKKNGKHVEFLKINKFDDYKALLSSGLSLSTIFPRLRLLKCLMFDLKTPECKAMVEECLQLKHLKHVGLLHCYETRLQIFFPLFSRLDSVFIDDISWRYHENWELCRGLKKLIVNSIRTDDDFNFILSKLPFEVELVTEEGWTLPLNTKRANYTWVYFRGTYSEFYLRLPREIGYSKNMELVGLKDVSLSNFIVIKEEHDFEQIIRIPNFVEHFTAYSAWHDCHVFLSKYAPNFPSLHLDCYNNILNYEEAPYQATSVSLGKSHYDGNHLYTLNSERFPSLQKLYVSNTIPFGNYYSGTFIPENFSLYIGLFPHLIHFFSKVPQANEFWPKLLEAAPKLQYIHTNYKSHNLLELLNQRPFLQFMPYQDILGGSGEIPEFTNVNR